ncbi:hypothetical protein CK934_15425 [Chitinophaga sp. MD30]|nr:hypothetical protein CK934_15425 [Chitinophaga sp. MD30]
MSLPLILIPACNSYIIRPRIDGVVLDADTRKPIPAANVRNRYNDPVATADDSGRFSVPLITEGHLTWPRKKAVIHPNENILIISSNGFINDTIDYKQDTLHASWALVKLDTILLKRRS